MISERSVNLFHKSAKTLPAYQSFLASKNFDPALVNDPVSFTKVPLTNKKNYLTSNKLQDLISSDSTNPLLFCATSGSTGEPYYFPRDDTLSWQYSFILENFIKYSSYGSGSVLALIGFGMGVWIGGIITHRAFEIAGQRLDTPLAILPTGYNKTELFKALRELSPKFDQTIIVGYPPFVKELVDEAESESVDLAKLNIRLLFAAEAFTETFRNYICQKASVQNPVLDTLNIYGTADIGAMAYETPLSILVRRLAIEDPLLYMDMFGQIEKTPTLAQYNPEFIEFETLNNEIILTADGAVPLIRYAIGDHGGIFDYDHVKSLMYRYGTDLEAEIDRAKISEIINRQQPFVYVYERTDLSATLHGINIYPEFVKEGLLQADMARYFTERFTMATKNDIHHNQFLQINLELQKDVEPSSSLERQALKTIRTNLVKKSSEYAEISKSQSASHLIRLQLWPNNHPRYFGPGTKQKWVEK